MTNPPVIKYDDFIVETYCSRTWKNVQPLIKIQTKNRATAFVRRYATAIRRPPVYDYKIQLYAIAK